MYVCLYFFKLQFLQLSIFCLDQSGYMTRHETQTTNRFLNESLTQSNGGHAMNGVIIFFPKKFFFLFLRSPYIYLFHFEHSDSIISITKFCYVIF